MLYIPNTDEYLKILTDDEMKYIVVKNFTEYFKSVRERLYSKLSEEQSLRKVAVSLYIFLTTPDKVEKYPEMMQSNFFDNCVHHYHIEISNLFDPELQLINTKPIIKNKFKKLLMALKKFKAHAVLVLECKRRNDDKVFYSTNC